MPPQGPDKIETAKLIADANAGHGCSILDAFDGKSLQSQVAAIAEMRAAFQNDPKSRVHGRINDSVHVNLYITENTTFSNFGLGDDLFRETFDAVFRKVKYECKDKSPNGNSSRMIERKF